MRLDAAVHVLCGHPLRQFNKLENVAFLYLYVGILGATFEVRAVHF